VWLFLQETITDPILKNYYGTKQGKTEKSSNTDSG
jgi:hypothetical protein